MIKETAPQGWKGRLNEWRYKYPDTNIKIPARYQSTVNYNKDNGLCLFNIVGTSDNPIEDEHLLKKAMISRLRKFLEIGKHILIISQQGHKGKDTYSVIVQLHCFLNSPPDEETLLKIKEALTDYSC